MKATWFILMKLMMGKSAGFNNIFNETHRKEYNVHLLFLDIYVSISSLKIGLFWRFSGVINSIISKIKRGWQDLLDYLIFLDFLILCKIRNFIFLYILVFLLLYTRNAIYFSHHYEVKNFKLTWDERFR